MDKKRVIVLVAAVLSLIISLIVYINGEKYITLRFKFFHEMSDKIVLEERRVLISDTRHSRAERVVEELFLGPMEVFNRKVTSFGFKPNSFYVRNKIAYLDLPVEFILDNKDRSYTFEDQLRLIEENILNNTWKISSVIITINGENPY